MVKPYYQVQKGFIDLSAKPKSLNNTLYFKILKIQMFLMKENKNIEYYKQPFNRLEFQKLQELSAKLQQIIFNYWGQEVLDFG